MELNRKCLEDFGNVLEISDTDFIVLNEDTGIHIKENAVYPVKVKEWEPLTVETVGTGVSYPDKRKILKALRDGMGKPYFLIR